MWFRVLLAILAILVLAALATSVLRLRSAWATSLEAARWVEAHVPLEDRLLTLVSAPPEAQRSRLWPELVRDNQGHLARWRNERLAIPAVPADLLLLAIAVLLAAVFLVPWGERAEPRPEPPLLVALPEPAERMPTESAARAAPAPGAAVVRGASSSASAEGPADPKASSALAAVDQIQAELGEAFRRSFGGQIVAGERERPEPGAEATAFRGDSPEAGIGDTESEPGGVPPPEGLARREDGVATGSEVKSLEPGGQGETGGSAGRGIARPAEERGEQPRDSGRGRPAGGKAGEASAIADAAGTGAASSGGAGAGSAKATAPLLADAPLTLSGGREQARFTLTLGAAAGKGGEGEAEMVSAPRGQIAAGARGDQAADRKIRREEVPPEYEGIVKRVFERSR